MVTVTYHCCVQSLRIFAISEEEAVDISGVIDQVIHCKPYMPSPYNQSRKKKTSRHPLNGTGFVGLIQGVEDMENCVQG